jgi:hypothetical protein
VLFRCLVFLLLCWTFFVTHRCILFSEFRSHRITSPTVQTFHTEFGKWWCRAVPGPAIRTVLLSALRVYYHDQMSLQRGILSRPILARPGPLGRTASAAGAWAVSQDVAGPSLSERRTISQAGSHVNYRRADEGLTDTWYWLACFLFVGCWSEREGEKEGWKRRAQKKNTMTAIVRGCLAALSGIAAWRQRRRVWPDRRGATRWSRWKLRAGASRNSCRTKDMWQETHEKKKKLLLSKPTNCYESYFVITIVPLLRVAPLRTSTQQLVTTDWIKQRFAPAPPSRINSSLNRTNAQQMWYPFCPTSYPLQSYL